MRGNRLRLGRIVAALAILALVLGVGPTQAATADPALNPPPSGVSVSQRSTMAILTWPTSPGATGYAVGYDTYSTFTTARQLTTTDTVLVLTGLVPETSYYVRVASWDAATGTTGQWSAPVSFTTAARVYPIAAPAMTLSSLTSTSISAELSSVGQDLAYEVALGKDPAKLDEVEPVEGLKHTFDGLQRNTKYYVSARALDQNGAAATAWSDPVDYTTPESLPLKVASYNIKCNSCQKKGEQSWSARKGAVVGAILGQMPDVLGVQEASQGRMKGRSVAQFEDLVNGLGKPYAVTSRSDIGGGAGVDNRIVYNTATVKLLKQGVVRLPTAKGANIHRYLTWATFRQKSTGKVFLFGDTHLEPGKKFNSLRVRQTQTVINALRKLAAKDELPTMLVGDFNFHKWMSKAGYQPYSMLADSGYLDPLGNTHRSHAAAPTAFVENRINTNFSTYNDFSRKAPAFSYANGTQLDFIFVTKMRVSEYEVVVKVDSQRRFIGTIPSDHNMVRATVWLP